MSKTNEGVDAINAKLDEYRKEGYNIPGITSLSYGPSHMSPVLHVVQLSTEVDDMEVYLTDNGYAIGHAGLMKLKAAGGIDFADLPLSESSIYSKEQDKLTAKAVGKRFNLDGTIKYHSDTKAIDFPAYEKAARDEYEKLAEEKSKIEKWDSDQKRVFVERNLKEYMMHLRKTAPQAAITAAQHRVIIKMLGLKSKYSLGELKKPFVIISMVLNVDMKDHDIKMMVTSSYLGIDMYQSGVGIPGNGGQKIDGNGKKNDNLPAREEISAPANTCDGFEDMPRSVQVSIIKGLLEKVGRASDFPLSSAGDEELLSLYGELLIFH